MSRQAIDFFLVEIELPGKTLLNRITPNDNTR